MAENDKNELHLSIETDNLDSCGSSVTSKPSPRSVQNHPLEELFKACDTKDNGVIGPEEFRELCDKFGIGSTDSDVIFADLDHDGDGNIDFEDFSYGFTDFLTPGSRRGSLQISPVADAGTNNQQLMEMEKRHASARTAWKHFMNNVGPTNIQPFISNSKEQLYDIDEEIRHDGCKEASPTLEKALTGLIMDVQHLHEEYKTLENSFRKEREVHAAQLVALGEELDQQLAKAEAKAKAEARQEAQRQMDAERKKIATEIEGQLADLSSQIRTFQKVEEWLAEEEAKEGRLKLPEDHAKLHEAESENRNLRSALVEAQMKATLLQTQLTQKRNEYLDLFNALHSEKIAASEYKSQVDLMQNHLVVLSEANRVLSDANDCLTTQVPGGASMSPVLGPTFVSAPPSSSSHQDGLGPLGIPHVNSFSCPNSLSIVDTLSESSCTSASATTIVKPSLSDPRFPCVPPTQSPFHETDRDSGRSTLLDEIRAEGDGSPLPSGIWSYSQTSCINNHELHCGTPVANRQQDGIRSSVVITQAGNGVGKIGSSCCGENNTRDIGSSNTSSSSYHNGRTNNRRRQHNSSAENTYKSFAYGEDSDLFEALAGGTRGGGGGSGCVESHLGNLKSPAQGDEENDKAFDVQTDESSASASVSFYPHRTFKVILAGDAAVGKSTFIERICHGHFTPNLSSTIGVDFRVKTIELDGKCVALQLWDTAGQERFRSLTKSYFRRADGVILMYDVSNERTFANIRNWIHNVEEGAGRKVPVVLSGNKVDLREDVGENCHHHPSQPCHHQQQQLQHFVSHTDGEKLARQCGAIFVETSPKTGHNVYEAIMMLAKEMSQVEDAELRNSLQLTDRLSEERLRKKGCCSSGGGGNANGFDENKGVNLSSSNE